MRKSLLILFFSLGLYSVGYCQDIHFSQNALAGFVLNPSKIGLFEADARLNSITKIQWNSVTVPFETYFASFDGAVYRRTGSKNQLSAGVAVQREVAGDASFGTTSVQVGAAWLTALNRRNRSFFSLGLSANVNQRSMNFEALNFESQFNGSFYDPNLSSEEQNAAESIIFPSVNVGIIYIYRPSYNEEVNIGWSIHSFNKPRLNYFEGSTIHYQPVSRLFFQYRSAIHQSLEINPELFIAFQNPFREIIPQMSIRQIWNNSAESIFAGSIGLGYRLGDAIIVKSGVDYLQWRFGLSYDVNISKLSAASRYKGGFEFALIRYFRKMEAKRRIEIPCPIF